MELHHLSSWLPPLREVIFLRTLNETKADWARELYNKYGVITSVFDVFHCYNSTQQISPPYRAYGIALNYPVYSLSVTTTCSLHPHLAYLGVDDNSNLHLKPGDEVILEYDNCLTFWKSIEGPGKAIWLRMDGRDAFIDRKKSYQITKLRDNSLLLNIT
jgi:hypothetical protein